MIDMNCDLCRLYHYGEIYTDVYNNDDICIIVDCQTCDVPMAVYKDHGIIPTEKEIEQMESKLLSIRRGILDDTMRTVPEHYHIHLRDFDEFV